MQFTGLGSTPAVQMTDSPIRSAEDAERGLQSADQLRTSRRIANEARNINAAGVTPKTKIITPSTSLAPCRHYREPDEMANGSDPQRLLTCQRAYRRVNGQS